MSRAVLVPGVLALLPEYAGQQDPVAEVRAACERAVAWVAADGPVAVLAGEQGRRVAEALLRGGGFETGAGAPSSTTGGSAGAPSSTTGSSSTAGSSSTTVLAVGNGSARRTEKAPGHVDDRAVPFDDALGEALASGRLAEVDLSLAGELWADTDAIAELAQLLPPGLPATIDHASDPFGVQYWVARWEW